IFDAKKVLNPGVIINADKQSHLKNLKQMPCADQLIDKCIECGFCEPICPSKNHSLTPRQRNAVYREICRLKSNNEDPIALANLEKSYQDFAVNSCAATGLCATLCPVGINTGDMMLKLRENHSPLANSIARCVGDNFSTITKLTKLSLSVTNQLHNKIGSNQMQKLNRVGQKLSAGKLPFWTSQTPRSAGKLNILSVKQNSDKKVVYFPSCAARTMGTAKEAEDRRPLTQVTQSLLQKAGYEVIFPEKLDQLCCGMPFKSKGFKETAINKAKQLELLLLQASQQGKYPILMDTSPCASTSKRVMSSELNIYEPFAFVAEFVIPNVSITQQQEPIMLHITCTSRKQGLASLMEKVCRVCAKEIIIPDDIQCCGFAGDKGFTLPELNKRALLPLKKQVPANCKQGYSNSRTCEIGLSHHSGIEYRSILYLLDKVCEKRIID
ncbi:MAG: (Fe-S)-binding protein, partial [Alteromonadales bacterium]|nr:(Fe-S)-binding protein [Alteromonadales bacterium]